jgi:cell division protein ZapB
MTSKRINAAEKLDLELLATQIEELIALCEGLQRENDRLRTRQSQLEAKQVHLNENNEFSRRKIEAMISRLKVLETEL